MVLLSSLSRSPPNGHRSCAATIRADKRSIMTSSSVSSSPSSIRSAGSSNTNTLSSDISDDSVLSPSKMRVSPELIVYQKPPQVRRAQEVRHQRGSPEMVAVDSHRMTPETKVEPHRHKAPVEAPHSQYNPRVSPELHHRRVSPDIRHRASPHERLKGSPECAGEIRRTTSCRVTPPPPKLDRTRVTPPPKAKPERTTSARLYPAKPAHPVQFESHSKPVPPPVTRTNLVPAPSLPAKPDVMLTWSRDEQLPALPPRQAPVTSYDDMSLARRSKHFVGSEIRARGGFTRNEVGKSKSMRLKRKRNYPPQFVGVLQWDHADAAVFGLFHLDKPKPNTGNTAASEEKGLVTIRMKPDAQGRFGFNVKGGVDQGMPITVSRVAANTSADTCRPRLCEGDQVLMINGRDVSGHTHEQVVMFIRAARETHSGQLLVVVRQKGFVEEALAQAARLEAENATTGAGSEKSVSADPTTTTTTSGISSLPASSATSATPPPPSGDELVDSLNALRESLASGIALQQFEQLQRKRPDLSMNAARLQENIPKNRYRDISPYDQTRFVIQGGQSGDYINANFVNMEIPGSGIVNRYIAGQGPLPTTCSDFWQMVWEAGSSLVVMLTTQFERGREKCHQYWPDLYEIADYGRFQITCHTEEANKSLAFREMTILNMESNEERHIRQMQYMAWPDHGVPDDPRDFLAFTQRVRASRDGNVEPTIVHCSAGIGRTGVLITMETAMCLIEAGQPVRPEDVVQQMRDQRAMLIQNSSQYKFVCEAILRVCDEGIVRPLDDFRRR